MNNAAPLTSEVGYRIGAVSRLSGVPAHTLRVWERRYGTVKPFRSEAGTRLYSQSDVDRLCLIKRLVDRGDAISLIANLPQETLEQRAGGAELPTLGSEAGRTCSFLVLDTTGARSVADGALEDDDLDCLGCFHEREDLIREAGGLEPDLLVLEYATIHPQQVREIGTLLLQVGAPRVLVVYGIAARSTLERLESPRVFPVQGPVDSATLRRWIRVFGARPAPVTNTFAAAAAEVAGAPPQRRFDDATLAAVAAAPATIRCECPEHLVDLITRLNAFAAYSEQCEVLHVEDAALHALLHASTARARSLLETSLANVIEADGITTDH